MIMMRARGPRSRLVNIALIPAGLGEAVQPGFCLLGTLATLLDGDREQRVLDVLGHALGVATDVEVRALLQPLPELGGSLLHAVLDIDLLRLVAREGEVEAVQRAPALPVHDLVLVEEVGRALLVAEEQPVLPLGATRLAFLEEGTERRDAGARADHDRGRAVIGRRAK